MLLTLLLFLLLLAS
jgi:hypothetical protein